MKLEIRQGKGRGRQEPMQTIQNRTTHPKRGIRDACMKRNLVTTIS